MGNLTHLEPGGLKWTAASNGMANKNNVKIFFMEQPRA